MLRRARALLETIVSLSLAAAVAAAAEEGLVAHYPFDQGAGTVAHDRSGNGYDGKITGAEWVKRGAGFALQFDGVTGQVDLGNPSGLNLEGDVTFMAWICPCLLYTSPSPRDS